MKKYFKIDDYEDAGIIQYAEFEGEYIYREVNRYNVEFYEDKEEWELSLNSQDTGLQGWSLTYLGYTKEDEISKEEFEKIWEYVKKLHQESPSNSQVQTNHVNRKKQNIVKQKGTNYLNVEETNKEVKAENNALDLRYKKNKDLRLTEKEDRPSVHFMQQTGEFIIIGRSILEDSGSFYAMLTNWVASYGENYPNKLITLKLDLEQINTSSQTFLLGFIQGIPSKNLQVEWYYETEDQEDEALDVAEMFEVPFYLINKITGEKYKVN